MPFHHRNIVREIGFEPNIFRNFIRIAAATSRVPPVLVRYVGSAPTPELWKSPTLLLRQYRMLIL